MCWQGRPPACLALHAVNTTQTRAHAAAPPRLQPQRTREQRPHGTGGMLPGGCLCMHQPHAHAPLPALTAISSALGCLGRNHRSYTHQLTALVPRPQYDSSHLERGTRLPSPTLFVVMMPHMETAWKEGTHSSVRRACGPLALRSV